MGSVSRVGVARQRTVDGAGSAAAAASAAAAGSAGGAGRHVGVDVFELAGSGGRAAVVAWQGVQLGLVERQVDGWHAYVHPLLDQAERLHLGHRAYDERLRAVELIVEAFTVQAEPVVATADGFEVVCSRWTSDGDEVCAVIRLVPASEGLPPLLAWWATAADRDTNRLLVVRSRIHGLYEVWSGRSADRSWLTTSLYSAAVQVAELAGVGS